MTNMSTGGQGKAPSPWGSDMAGNVVERLVTVAPQPPGDNFLRSRNSYHGGVANLPACQLEISALGSAPADFTVQRVYPWLGGCPGVIGNL
jgi:hypothetical protein